MGPSIGFFRYYTTLLVQQEKGISTYQELGAYSSRFCVYQFHFRGVGNKY